MKKTTLISMWLFAGIGSFGQEADAVLRKIDQNMASDSRIFESAMTVHTARNTRTITSKTWSAGDNLAFTEYLSPPREQGTKMLKIDNQLWIYSPNTDRIIQISGHMLRQSVMGSDLSYEDMMDNSTLTKDYDATIHGIEEINGRSTLILGLVAKHEKVTYASRKIWVDAERFVPLKEELYARSGQLLKKTELSDIRLIEGRWFPFKIVFRDMLKAGNGTVFEFRTIEFDRKIPEHMFTKAALK
jgi:outer membrane lipoprotein-sorting protein